MMGCGIFEIKFCMNIFGWILDNSVGKVGFGQQVWVGGVPHLVVVLLAAPPHQVCVRRLFVHELYTHF